MDTLISHQNHMERWTIYHAYVSNCWSQKYQYEVQLERTLAIILEKLSPEREHAIMQECLRPFGIADHWKSIYVKQQKKTYRTLDYKRLREIIGEYEQIIHNKNFYDLPRRIWSHLTMDEVRQYIPYIE